MLILSWIYDSKDDNFQWNYLTGDLQLGARGCIQQNDDFKDVWTDLFHYLGIILLWVADLTYPVHLKNLFCLGNSVEILLRVVAFNVLICSTFEVVLYLDSQQRVSPCNLIPVEDK